MHYFIRLVVFGLFLLLTNNLATAQQFLPPVERFSGSKPGYIILKTGERVEFILDDLDRKKGDLPGRRQNHCR